VTQRIEALARSARVNFLDIDVLCTVRHRARGMGALHTRFTTIENLLGLVNGIAVSIHHIGNRPRFCPVAFIFGENARLMVNRWCEARFTLRPRRVPT
jgi:hypothetical protein